MDAARDRLVDQAYREHAPMVYRLALAILRHPDDALDATHDAFARAWERWDQYDDQRPLTGWLHGIIVNVALDRLRRRRVRRIVVALADAGPIATTRAGDDPAAEAIRRGQVEAVLDACRPDARAALVLRHVHGYDYEGIAALLRTSPGNVGSMLSRAHADLRRRFGGDSDGPVPSAAATAPPGRSAPTFQSAPEPPETPR